MNADRPNLTAATAIATARRKGRCEGMRRKDAAHALLLARREVLIRRAQRALLFVLLGGAETATADDVRAAVELPPDLDPRLLGAVPGSLARAGILRANGFETSTRPERHASYLRRWQLADREAALAWLVRNPASPPPGEELPPFDAAKQERPTAATAGRSNQFPPVKKGINDGSTH